MAKPKRQLPGKLSGDSFPIVLQSTPGGLVPAAIMPRATRANDGVMTQEQALDLEALAGLTSQIVLLNAVQTLTNKTLDAPVFDDVTVANGNIEAPHFVASGAPSIALGTLPGTGPNGAAVSFGAGSNDEAGSISVTYGTDFSNPTGDPNDDVFVLTLANACTHGIAVNIWPTNTLTSAYWNSFHVDVSKKIRQINTAQWALTYPAAAAPTVGQPYTFCYQTRCY